MNEDTKQKRIKYLEEKLKDNQMIIDAADKEILDLTKKSKVAQKRYNHHKSQIAEIAIELKELEGNLDNE